MKKRRVREKHSQKSRGLDLYETAPEATRALLRAVPLPHGLWEPHCGRGAIANLLMDAGHAVACTDFVNRGYPYQQATIDFLQTQRVPDGVEAIVMNPPYAWAALHIQHALTICPMVVALLPLSFMEAGNEKTAAGLARLWCLDRGYLARVYVFKNRVPMMHRDGWEGPISTSNVPYAWFVFDGDHYGPAFIHRISWE